MAKQVTFSPTNIGKDNTPKAAKWVFRTIATMSGIWALIPPDLLHVCAAMKADINTWLLISQPVILVITKNFGWKYVPTE